MTREAFELSKKGTLEYSCRIVRIGELTPIEGSDFLSTTQVMGNQVIVRKDLVCEGDIMVYAANETEVNTDFLSVNNMFEFSERDKNANAAEVNELIKPYLEAKSKADIIKQEASKFEAENKEFVASAKKITDKMKLTADEVEREKLNKEYLANISKAMENTSNISNLKNDAYLMVKASEYLLNDAKAKCGFFNKNGRVRCITLKGKNSFGVLFSIKNFLKFDNTLSEEDFTSNVGVNFDTINGKLFVKAYVPKLPFGKEKCQKIYKETKVKKRFERVVGDEFKFHYTTRPLDLTIEDLTPDQNVSISVKLHGTSAVIAKLHVRVPVKLNLYQKCFNFVYKLFNKEPKYLDYKAEYGPIYSSRKVIKNKYINKNVNPGFYQADIWEEFGDMIYPYLSKEMTVYGEICGYVTGTSKDIQKLYHYGCERGENFFMPYRITTLNEDGSFKEWNIDEVLAWTISLKEKMKADENENSNRIHPIDICYHGKLKDLYPNVEVNENWNMNILSEMMKDKKNFLMECNEPMCIDAKVPREGIVLRIDDSAIEAKKLKCIAFKLKEAILIDAGDIDMEMEETYEN